MRTRNLNRIDRKCAKDGCLLIEKGARYALLFSDGNKVPVDFWSCWSGATEAARAMLDQDEALARCADDLHVHCGRQHPAVFHDADDLHQCLRDAAVLWLHLRLRLQSRSGVRTNHDAAGAMEMSGHHAAMLALMLKASGWNGRKCKVFVEKSKGKHGQMGDFTVSPKSRATPGPDGQWCSNEAHRKAEHAWQVGSALLQAEEAKKAGWHFIRVARLLLGADLGSIS